MSATNQDEGEGLDPFSNEFMDLMDTVTHDRMDDIEWGLSATPVKSYERAAILRRRATRRVVDNASRRLRNEKQGG